MIAHANAVIDYYVNGPGSYWDAGTQKPLLSDDEVADRDSTANDLKKFKAQVIAAKQFADDPGSVMDSIIALIDQATRQIEDAARYSEGRNSISGLPPETIDPIDDPRVISPRALNDAALPILFEKGRRAEPLQTSESYEVSNASPVRILSRKTISVSPPPTSSLGDAPASDFSNMAARHSDAQNIRVLASRVVPGGGARNGTGSWLGIPDQSVSSSQSNLPIGLVTNKPMSQWILPPSVFGFSTRSGPLGSDLGDWPATLVGISGDRVRSPSSASDAGAPAAPSNEFRSHDRQSFRGGGNDGLSDAPGGLAGRIAAITGIQPADTDPRVLQENGFYNDGLSQPWLFRALSGRF
jgi:hypothetical protein